LSLDALRGALRGRRIVDVLLEGDATLAVLDDGGRIAVHGAATLVFVSLHESMPAHQLDGEVSYPGYRRMPLHVLPGTMKIVGDVVFPESVGTKTIHMRYAALGTAAEGPGEVIRVIALDTRGGLPMGLFPGVSPQVHG
jgi:hypothetical protein